jgi:hypothetical protein
VAVTGTAMPPAAAFPINPYIEMNRAGNLTEKIAVPPNLYLAFYKAVRGKRDKQAVVDYQNNLDNNIADLCQQILSSDVSVGNYH